jgi:hypothetical protein
MAVLGGDVSSDRAPTMASAPKMAMNVRALMVPPKRRGAPLSVPVSVLQCFGGSLPAIGGPAD